MTKLSWRVACVALIALSGCDKLTPSAPIVVPLRGGEVAVSLPSLPQPGRRNQPGPDGDEYLTLNVHGHVYTTTSIVLTSRSDPERKRLLVAGEQGALKAVTATATESAEFVFGPGRWPARSCRAADRDGFHLRMLLVASPTRIYDVSVGGPAAFVDGPEAARFLASLSPAGPTPTPSPSTRPDSRVR